MNIQWPCNDWSRLRTELPIPSINLRPIDIRPYKAYEFLEDPTIDMVKFIWYSSLPPSVTSIGSWVDLPLTKWLALSVGGSSPSPPRWLWCGRAPLCHPWLPGVFCVNGRIAMTRTTSHKIDSNDKYIYIYYIYYIYIHVYIYIYIHICIIIAISSNTH